MTEVRQRDKCVALYCRVDRGGSPEDLKLAANLQKSKLERYAKRQNLSVVASYEDIGFVGDDLSRPGFNAMLADCLNGLFETVLVVNQSRVFRDFSADCPDWPFKILSLDTLNRQFEL